MSTKEQKKKSVAGPLAKLLSTKDPVEKHQIETGLIHFAFISAVERIMLRKDWTKKDLAKAVKTSPSFITQLFRGDKTVNLSMLARFQKVLDMEFHIEGCSKEEYISIMRYDKKQLGITKDARLMNLSDYTFTPDEVEEGVMIAS